MSRPGYSDVHKESTIGAISVAVAMEVPSAASRLAPYVPVSKSSDYYRTYDAADLKGAAMDVRARGQKASRGGFGATHETYQTTEYAHGYEIPWETIREDDLMEVEIVAQRTLQHRKNLKEDALFIASFFQSSIWTGLGIGGVVDGTPSTKWSTGASSVPLSDLRTARQGVVLGSGGLASWKDIKLALPRTVMDALQGCSEIRDQFKYTSDQSITPEMLARVLEIGEVVIFEGVYNSAAEGQTATMAFQADDAALMLYVPQTPGRLTPAAAYTFVCPPGMAGPSAAPGLQYGALSTRQYDEVAEARTVYEGAIALQQKQIMASAGVYLPNVL